MTALLLLWLAGIGLRLTLLAVPPVIPLLHEDLQLSESDVGVLSSLPALLFALAAVPGSLLVARLGAVWTLVAGLLLTALASALRGAATDALQLFATTFLMGAGVAVMQPALPMIVREWLPGRIGLGTATYSNGLLVGEVIPAALTIPYLLPFAGGSWRWSFVLWALPVLATALLLTLLAPRADRALELAVLKTRRWWPDWRNGRIWRLGFMMASVNSIYFGTNAFLPDYLHATGRPGLVGPALTMLNLTQLPASFILLVVANRLVGRRWPFIAGGSVALASFFGLVLMPGAWIVLWASALGFAAAWMLVLLLALPPLLSAPDDTHRTAAAMFTISYSCSVVIPVLGGLAWDASAIPALAFVPLGLCALAILALAAKLELEAASAPPRATGAR